ncbi:hypothetical protein [uncultured Campylobacter sp.]|uniref:hypothetical protein n=1 Tax=uncultured Campylobacter sp. TaxID=218934 RepID=UPI00260FF529|nr:hypothetical protein [uncultured Campylobacter sp.]
MQKPEFSLICDDTFYRIFSVAILAFFCIFISLDIGGSGELFYTDSPLRSQRAKPSLTIVFMFLALLYLRSGSKEAARVEFDGLKISFRRGLDKYDLMLGCVDLIEPSFGFVRTFRVPFISYERFLKLQEILKFLLLFAYVAGVFLTIKFGFAEAAIYAATGIFAILIASKLVVARRLDGRAGLRLRDCLLLRGRDDTGAAVFFCIRPSRAEREALRIYFLKNFSYDIKA